MFGFVDTAAEAMCVPWLNPFFVIDCNGIFADPGPSIND